MHVYSMLSFGLGFVWGMGRWVCIVCRVFSKGVGVWICRERVDFGLGFCDGCNSG